MSQSRGDFFFLFSFPQSSGFNGFFFVEKGFKHQLGGEAGVKYPPKSAAVTSIPLQNHREVALRPKY